MPSLSVSPVTRPKEREDAHVAGRNRSDAPEQQEHDDHRNEDANESAATEIGHARQWARVSSPRICHVSLLRVERSASPVLVESPTLRLPPAMAEYAIASILGQG